MSCIAKEIFSRAMSSLKITEESKGSSSKDLNIKLNSRGLKSRPDLVAVDGVLYDVNNIAKSHPGGSIVLASGGTFFFSFLQTQSFSPHRSYKALYCVYNSII